MVILLWSILKMKTAKQTETTLGILDAIIKVAAEVNEKDEEGYNQLIFDFCQRVDCAIAHQIRIPCVTKKEVLKLTSNIKQLARYFPKE